MNIRSNGKHLEWFGWVGHAQEYPGIHCCCASLRIPRFPFPCCSGFWWIWDPPLDTILGNFLTFSVIWGIKNHVWIADRISDDFWMENLLNSDVPTSQKHSKYCGFHKISHFSCFQNFDDFRHPFWHHFGAFWWSLGTMFVIFRCVENTLKFHWISRVSLGTQK